MKKLFSLLLAVFVFSVCIPVTNAVNYDGFFLEKNSEDTYTITSCNIFTDYLSIPETYNGVEITAIGQGAFQLKKDMSFVRIPDTIKSIGSMAFYGCTGLTDVYIGEGVKNINAKAFNSCSSLETINIKNTEMIGEMAFTGCKALTGFSSNGALKVIGKSAFSNCVSLTNPDLGENILYIGDRAFSGCSSITELNFANKLGFIGNSAFQDCTNLSSVTFGTGKLEIAAFAFENCKALTEITIPNNVESIGTNAFALREAGTTATSHNITITCSKAAPAIKYVKSHAVSAYITEYETSISAFGDINGDEIITTADSSQLLSIISGVESYSFTDYEMFLYDLDCNNTMDTTDVKILLKKAADIA